MKIIQKIDKKFSEFVFTKDYKDFFFNSPISYTYDYEIKKDRVKYIVDLNETEYNSFRYKLYLDKDLNIKNDKEFYKLVYMYVFFNNNYKYYSMELR